MSGIFSGLNSGIKFPETVWNSGPLPPQGGLPAPLHSTADGKYNYNSTLLGDLQPYAYGDGAYLSSQHSYLNIPHRIQKIIPIVYLPEPSGEDLFRLSHPVDDGDLAFTMRINKQSMFCTGCRGQTTRRAGLGTAIVDPLINLPTLNYILAGMQLCDPSQRGSLWMSLLHAFDPDRFPDPTTNGRNYTRDVLGLPDLVYIIQHCVRPFGVMRGSEKQGGQSEEGTSAVSWPVPFVGTLVIDGREEHIVNMWHAFDVNSGEDLVLRLKPMPLKRYTLNHYYKNPISKHYTHIPREHQTVWQLVPDVMKYEIDDHWLEYAHTPAPEMALRMPIQWYFCTFYTRDDIVLHSQKSIFISAARMSWQELGFWHIGRTQIRLNKYVTDSSEYYHNDMVNALRHQHMLMTVQPVWDRLPYALTMQDLREHVNVPGVQALLDDGEGGDRDGLSLLGMNLRLEGMVGGIKRNLAVGGDELVEGNENGENGEKRRSKWTLVKLAKKSTSGVEQEVHQAKETPTVSSPSPPTASEETVFKPPLTTASEASATTTTAATKKGKVPRSVTSTSKPSSTGTGTRITKEGEVEQVDADDLMKL